MAMMKYKMDLAQLWQAWPIAGPWRLSPLAGGTNNLVWRGETADGEFYVLRLFPDLTQLPRLRYEVALLRAFILWPGVDRHRAGERFLNLQADQSALLAFRCISRLIG